MIHNAVEAPTQRNVLALWNPRAGEVKAKEHDSQWQEKPWFIWFQLKRLSCVEGEKIET